MTKEEMLNRYEKLSASEKYIVGFELKGLIYFFFCDTLRDLDIKVEKKDNDNVLRLRFKTDTKFGLKRSSQVLCNSKDFMELVGKYNKGEAFERIITEKYGQIWKKDNTRFDKDGDITINDIKYQIKFDNATITKESLL